MKPALSAALAALALAPLPASAAELPLLGSPAPLEALKPEPAAPTAKPVPAVPDTLSLEQALRFALDNNFAIQQARERIREQEGLIVEVRAQALPNVSLIGNYTRDDKDLAENRGPGSPASYQNWTIGLQARQLLYQGGGVSAALSAARSTRAAALLDLQATISLALLDVRTKFADVLLARESIEVQEQNVALLGEQLQTVKNRFDAGSVSQFEVLRAEVARANAQPALIRAKNAYRLAVEELRVALGYRQPGQPGRPGAAAGQLAKVPEFVGELAFDPVTYELEPALAAARAKRPELQRFESLVAAREDGVTNARSGYLPELYLVGGYGERKSSFSNSFRDNLDGWSVGVEGSWAIFDGMRTAGAVRQARSLLRQAELTLAEQTLNVEVEVRRALNSLQEAAELAAAAAKVVEQAEEALRLADARYASGAATQLDVLEARVALTDARLNRVQANYSHTVALARVRQAIAEADTFAVE